MQWGSVYNLHGRCSVRFLGLWRAPVIISLALPCPASLPRSVFARRHASWLDGPVHSGHLSREPPLPYLPSLPLHATILLAGDMPQACPHVIKAVLAPCKPWVLKAANPSVVATNTVHVPTTCLMMQRHARLRGSDSCCLSSLHACTLVRLRYS